MHLHYISISKFLRLFQFSAHKQARCRLQSIIDLESHHPEKAALILKPLNWVKPTLLWEECKVALYAACLLKSN